MDDEFRLSRQAGLITGNTDDFHIAFIGLGGIGSNAIHMAASMGFRHFSIFDPDQIGDENVHPAWLWDLYIDDDKVDGIIKQLEASFGSDWFDFSVSTRRVDVLGDDDVYDIVIIGTDTLKSRRNIYLQNKGFCRWWIDGRMGGPLATVYTVDMEDEDSTREYELTLYAEESPLPCGEKATAPLTMGWIPAFIGQALTDIVNGDNAPSYIQRYDLFSGMFICVDEPRRDGR